MLFKKKQPEIAPLHIGEKAPNFQLPSAQGGLFRLDMRSVHGPLVLAFAEAGEESRKLLEELKEREEEFRRAGAYNCS